MMSHPMKYVRNALVNLIEFVVALVPAFAQLFPALGVVAFAGLTPFDVKAVSVIARITALR